jgi:hypothetical protein
MLNPGRGWLSVHSKSAFARSPRARVFASGISGKDVFEHVEAGPSLNNEDELRILVGRYR